MDFSNCCNPPENKYEILVNGLLALSLSVPFPVLFSLCLSVCHAHAHKHTQIITIMLTQPFVPTFEGIMKDYYSTDRNQPEVNSFKVSIHYTFSKILQVCRRQASHCLIFILI